MAVVAALLLFAASAGASKEVIAFFGGLGTEGGQFAEIGSTEDGDNAVNTSGTGPSSAGEVYVVDGGNNRIQRFARNDNGTPGDPRDDTYAFLSAWGADVDATPDGGADFEICTVASECQAGESSPGTGAAAGNGGLSHPIGIAIDQDTGNVFVSDSGNARVNVYTGDGAFLRSFGFDVVAAGPGDTGSGFERCVASAGDVCKGGVVGAGAGQVSAGSGIAVSPGDGDTGTGTVFLADRGNHRVNTYALDGSTPASFGSALFGAQRPRAIAVDSRGIVYASDDFSTDESIQRYDSLDANGSGVGFLAPIPSPPLFTLNNGTVGLEVDLDSDGVGPEEDVLYVLRSYQAIGDGAVAAVQQFGPVNDPGQISAPGSADDLHGGGIGFDFAAGLGLDESTGQLFVANGSATEAGFDDNGVFVLGAAGAAPTASLDSIADVTKTSATVNATVDPNGPPMVSYHLEYSLDGSQWLRTPEVNVGVQDDPQSVTANLQPPPIGLVPNTFYFVRLAYTKAFSPTEFTAPQSFTTLPAPPIAETAGAPVRTTSTAQLGGRVTPQNSSTTYHFEYGDQGPCDANACTSTASASAGSGALTKLVSEEVTGLQPSTTYHYRLVADNGNVGSPVFGEDRTVSTRANEAALSHGHFPGPPGSDRAWEQVNAPDIGGNNVEGVTPISDDGTRALWGLAGGSPLSESGGFNLFYSERTPSGWQARKVFPPRDQLPGPNWQSPMGPSDLSSFVALGANFAGGAFALFRMGPGAPAVKLHQVASEAQYGFFDVVADDGSRVLMVTKDSADPQHPVATNVSNLYDVTTPGTPRLVSLLPGEDIATCGVVGAGGSTSPFGIEVPLRITHWVSADGDLAFFMSRHNTCNNPPDIYARDLDAEETKLLSGPALSGPNCGAGFIRSTTEAAFFWTKTRLVAEDVVTANCNTGASDGDVYRYDLGDDSLECVTCVIPDGTADVSVANIEPTRRIAIPDDGSRVYFRSSARLLPGASPLGLYRVNTETGDLAYLADAGDAEIGVASPVTPDGSVLVFSSSHSSLNPLGGGAGNADTQQLYRYDDRDRSLVCVSCPQDGSAPRGPASGTGGGGRSPNTDPLSDQGDIFAFSTPTPLATADQNTAGLAQESSAGADAYEWRDGRLLLVSDGLTNWTGGNSAPNVKGMTPSGSDILFIAAAQYTPDALDDFRRLYTARIGGGIEFPKPPPPCPLEVCQGTPKGTPEEAAAGTGSFTGPGNKAKSPGKPSRCAKGKRLIRRGGKARCVKRHKNAAKQRRNQANQDRRAGR